MIAYPVRDSLGRMVGSLEVASFDPARPLTREDLGDVSVIADLAALAYERSSFLAQETARNRIELVLKRAAADIIGSLETEEVLRHVAEHALPAVNADRAVVCRMLPSGELARAASAPAEGGPIIDAGQVAQVAQARAPGAVRGRRGLAPTCRWCWARACSACCRWPATARSPRTRLEILLRLARTLGGRHRQRGALRAGARGRPGAHARVRPRLAARGRRVRDRPRCTSPPAARRPAATCTACGSGPAATWRC